MQEIERIQKMEMALDALTASRKNIAAALADFSGHLDQLKELSEYYGSAAFHHDLALDEAGKLPADLKRGVLSEDAVYDLITDLSELSEEMHRVAENTMNHIKRR